MVSSREALIDGGLELTRRPGGAQHSNSAAARRAVDPRQRGPRSVKVTTSRGLGQRQVSESAAGSARYRIRPADAGISRRQLAESLAEVRRLRPELPVRTFADGKLSAGLEATVHGDGYLLGCVSAKHWTRNLALGGFPEGVRVTVFGPNGILIRPVSADETVSED